MALTRAALREMGVTEKEQLDAIMEAHGAGIEAAKEKAKDLAEAAAQRTIDALQAKVDSLPAADGEDWKAKYEAEAAAHAATKSDYESEKTTAAKTAKLEKLLVDKYGANPKYAAKMAREFDLDGLKDDGDSFKDFDKALEPVKTEWPDMFGTTNTEGFKPATPPTAGNAGAYAGKTIIELMAEANKNPGETDKILSHIETMTKTQTGGNPNG